MNWRELRACGPETSHLFHGVGRSAAKAKEICKTCPVTDECLAFAMKVEACDWDRWGIFGGLSPEERRKRSKGAA